MDKKTAIKEMMDNMTEKELSDIYETARKEMGGDMFPLDVFCPTSVAKWWRSATQKEKDCLQLLFSRFCLALIGSAADTSAPDFNLRCMVALAILKGDITVSDRSSDDMGFDPDGGNDGEDTDKRTFH